MSETVTVNKKALKEVLEALVGPSHHIHTPLLSSIPKNPVKILLEDFDRQPAPVWFHAECSDPDYSAFFQNHADALERVSDYGGEVTALFE